MFRLPLSSWTWEGIGAQRLLVLRRMNEYNLKLSPKKLKVGRRAIRLLGQEITAAGIRPDPRKVAQIKAWPFPAAVTRI